VNFSIQNMNYLNGLKEVEVMALSWLCGSRCKPGPGIIGDLQKITFLYNHFLNSQHLFPKKSHQ